MSDPGIVIVGHAGYIGARLCEQYTRNHRVTGVDLGVYGRPKAPATVRKVASDVADVDPAYWKGKVVVYLASFHREPPKVEDYEAWRAAYFNLMVHHPVRILDRGARALIYVSSMRAITDLGSLYGCTKSTAEQVLVWRPNTAILRPGTVWGALDPNLPNRPNTAVNSALVRGKFEGDHWSAYTCHMATLLAHLVLLTEEACGEEFTVFDSPVQNAIDLSKPMTADMVRALLRGKFTEHPELQKLFDAEREATQRIDVKEDLRAAKALQIYYHLKGE